jgi:hypothetical protein
MQVDDLLQDSEKVQATFPEAEVVSSSHVDPAEHHSTPMNQRNVTDSVSVHTKRKMSKAPLVVSDVRRSSRLECKSKGFKIDASNPEKDYFCCTIDPQPVH